MERVGVAFVGSWTPTEIVELVKLAEELGYESAWVAEGHGGDQFSILTACAVATERILLGTCITSVFVRSAPTIAMAAACVDYYSQGRFILGLGSSHKIQVEPEHGLVFSQPVQRLRESMDIISALLRDGQVSYKGDVFDIQSFDLWFKPFRSEIPIYVAAVFPKMLEICGEISKGTILTYCTLERARLAAKHMAIGATRAGKDPDQLDVATLLPCAVSDHRDEATYAMRGATARYAARFPRYRRMMDEAGFGEEIRAVAQAWNEGDRDRAVRLVPTELIDKIAVMGTPEECRERIRDYRRAGITLPLISPRASGKDSSKGAMEAIRACAPR